MSLRWENKLKPLTLGSENQIKCPHFLTNFLKWAEVKPSFVGLEEHKTERDQLALEKEYKTVNIKLDVLEVNIYLKW